VIGSGRRTGRRLAAIVVVLLAGLVLSAVFIKGRGISARRDPWPIEARAARAAWRFLVPPDVARQENPLPENPDVLNRGLEHFADHCASCHANDGSGDTVMGRNMHPRAPDMRLPATQDRTDGELFYAIEQGIPWTGMPAWGTGTPDGETSSWELVRFIRYLPALTDADLRRMEALNPKSQADHDREHEIDEFLKGPATGAGS
jgi:mono/diheme cytochrome c family protein